MTEYCSFCGNSNPPYERHHIAGYINNPLWTARACIRCHQILSAWQWARRTPRSKENEPPDEIKLQAMYEGLSSAYSLACEYTGHKPEDILSAQVVTRILKHDPDPMKGKTFSLAGDYPKFKAKQPVRTGNMMGANFQRVSAAMCDIMASLAEDSSQPELAKLLRSIAERIPFGWPRKLPKTDFLVALSTADKTIIKDLLLEYAADFATVMGVEL